MPATANIRRLSLAMAIIIAMVAVVLPLCMMVACGMSASQMAGSPVLGFSADCINTMTSSAPAAINPGSPLSGLLMLVVVVGLAYSLAVPPTAMRLVRVVAEDPPAPPEDPRGVRLII